MIRRDQLRYMQKNRQLSLDFPKFLSKPFHNGNSSSCLSSQTCLSSPSYSYFAKETCLPEETCHTQETCRQAKESRQAQKSSQACEERNRKQEVCLGGKSQKDEERPDEAGNDDEGRKSCRKAKRCWNSVTSVPGIQRTHCRGTHKERFDEEQTRKSRVEKSACTW